MLVIHANQKQEEVFNKLIQEIDAQIVWNGRFVIMGDRLVLEGFVRSLFFHFDIQKAEVRFVELPTDDEKELEISAHPELEDLITMAVYAFENRYFFGSCRAGKATGSSSYESERKER